MPLAEMVPMAVLLPVSNFKVTSPSPATTSEAAKVKGRVLPTFRLLLISKVPPVRKASEAPELLLVMDRESTRTVAAVKPRPVFAPESEEKLDVMLRPSASKIPPLPKVSMPLSVVALASVKDIWTLPSAFKAAPLAISNETLLRGSVEVPAAAKILLRSLSSTSTTPPEVAVILAVPIVPVALMPSRRSSWVSLPRSLSPALYSSVKLPFTVT